MTKYNIEQAITDREEAEVAHQMAVRAFDLNRERRLRSLAIIHDLSIRKSRRRDGSFPDFGKLWIIDPHTSANLAGDEFGLSLDEAEEWLTDYIALNPQTSVPGNPA